MAFTGIPGINSTMVGSSPNGILDFIKSPGGSSLLSGILGGIGAMGQGKREERMSREQQAMQQAIMQQQLGLQGAQGLMNDSLTRDLSLEQAAPLGWSQGYEQQQLLRNMLLQKLMNGPSVQPTNPEVMERLKASGWQPFKPTIPEEWTNVNPFGVDQTMGALANRQGILDKLSGGRAPGLDFAHMGLPEEMANRYGQQTSDYRKFAADDYNSNAARVMEAINLNRQGTNQRPPQSSGGSRLGGAAGGALSGAGVGMTFGGPIGAGIGAGIGGLLGLFKGGAKKEAPLPQTPAMSPYSAPTNPYISRPHVMPQFPMMPEPSPTPEPMDLQSRLRKIFEANRGY